MPGRLWTGCKQLRNWVPALVLMLVLIGGVAPHTARAQSSGSVEWTQFNVDLDVQPDGTIHVTEYQEIDFRGGPFRNGFAEIPLSRIDGVANVEISEISEDGTSTPFQQARTSTARDENTFYAEVNGAVLNIDYHFQSARNETRTFVLEYDLVGVVRVYTNLDPPNEQIWWTAIASDTTESAPVESSTVTLTLPQAVPVDQVFILNEDGKLADSATSHTSDGRTFTWQDTDLRSGDSLEIRIQFPPVVNAAAPAWQLSDDAQREADEKREDRQSLFNLIFLAIAGVAVVGGGIGLYILWFVRGRDPQIGVIASFLPEPPDDLPPGSAGVLLDEIADERDIVATVLDLSRRGVFQIDETRSSTGSGMKVLMKDSSLPMTAVEKAVLDDLFNGNLASGQSISIVPGSLSNPAKLRELLYKDVVERGYFERSPEQVRKETKSIARVISVVSIGALFIAPRLFDTNWVILPIFVVILLSVILGWLSADLPRRTLAGAEAAAKWRAFRTYLDDIQKYEKLDESTEIFEKYLPYATAFGLDQSWVRKFSPTNVPAPNWYGPVVIGDFGSGRDYRGPGGSSGGNWNLPNSESQGRSGSNTGGGLFNFPDGGLQDWSDRASGGAQGASDGFAGMLESAARAFGSFSGGSGSSSGGGRRSSGSFGSRGGSRGFSGGGSRGGSSGGGKRGFS